jgi:hypothetical protein
MKLKKNNPKAKSMFEELSVTLLEERLELANRCLCRISP